MDLANQIESVLNGKNHLKVKLDIVSKFKNIFELQEFEQSIIIIDCLEEKLPTKNLDELRSGLKDFYERGFLISILVNHKEYYRLLSSEKKFDLFLACIMFSEEVQNESF